MSEPLQEIRDATYTQQTVTLDGCHFIACVFKDCDLKYHGGPIMLLETEIIGCRWHFGAAAYRTINLLQFFGLDVPEFASEGPLRLN